MLNKILANIAIAVFISLFSGCGGGGSGNSTTSNTPLSSTTTISSYMSSAYSSDQITLATDLQALVRSLASQGYLCSGNEIIAVANLKETHVQTFLNAVIANIQLVKTNNPIDKTAIAALFNTYQSEDVAWLTSSSTASAMGNCGFTGAMISATGYVTTINSYYANAIIQLNAM